MANWTSEEMKRGVEALMKRCQIGVGGRHALDDAHDIMADAYRTLGALMHEVERLRSALASATQAVPQVQPAMIERMKDAVEGELDGLAITDDHARAILEYVLAETEKPE